LSLDFIIAGLNETVEGKGVWWSSPSGVAPLLGGLGGKAPRPKMNFYVIKGELEALMSLYRSPDITKSS